mmetsp:Transcript_139003/g.387699  ORF Transcript_139003/g.387699 Transcript_139003/m.387699 type:complete len:204 (-) Transcript_139003:624-1235(-)
MRRAAAATSAGAPWAPWPWAELVRPSRHRAWGWSCAALTRARCLGLRRQLWQSLGWVVQPGLCGQRRGRARRSRIRCASWPCRLRPWAWRSAARRHQSPRSAARPRRPPPSPTWSLKTGLRQKTRVQTPMARALITASTATTSPRRLAPSRPLSQQDSESATAGPARLGTPAPPATLTASGSCPGPAALMRACRRRCTGGASG